MPGHSSPNPQTLFSYSWTRCSDFPSLANPTLLDLLSHLPLSLLTYPRSPGHGFPPSTAFLWLPTASLYMPPITLYRFPLAAHRLSLHASHTLPPPSLTQYREINVKEREGERGRQGVKETREIDREREREYEGTPKGRVTKCIATIKGTPKSRVTEYRHS